MRDIWIEALDASAGPSGAGTDRKFASARLLQAPFLRRRRKRRTSRQAPVRDPEARNCGGPAESSPAAARKSISKARSRTCRCAECPISRSLGVRSLMVEVHPTLRPELLELRAECARRHRARRVGRKLRAAHDASPRKASAHARPLEKALDPRRLRPGRHDGRVSGRPSRPVSESSTSHTAARCCLSAGVSFLVGLVGALSAAHLSYRPALFRSEDWSPGCSRPRRSLPQPGSPSSI